MTIRAFNEAARAFLLWAAFKSDVAHRSEDEKDREAVGGDDGSC
jgi:acyl-CoA dehydrogenase